MAPRVKFLKVRKHFGKQEILKDITLEIQPGEFFVLLGPSGSGKSTLLRLLAGLEELTSGEIWIGDQPVHHLPPKERGVAMVFQDYALYPHMTVWENLAFGLLLRKLPKEEVKQRVEEVAHWLGLTPKLSSYPAQLSGGEKQRVAIGRAIVKRPKVFLFDEPLSNLDAKLRAETRTLIAKLHRKLQVTTLYVTHDQQEAMTLAQRLAILSQGKLEQLGSPLQLYHCPANHFVASFLGAGMNFCSGEILLKNDQLLFLAPGISLSLPLSWQTHLSRLPLPCELGIRPEDLELTPPFHGKGKVVLKEPLGRDQILHLEGEFGEWKIQLPLEKAISPCDLLSFHIPLSKVHFFSTQGERLGGGEWTKNETPSSPMLS